MPKISGKIAAIFSERTLVINRGETHGVKEGMIFAVQLCLPRIEDPEDASNILDGLYYEKGRIKVSQLYDKMSFCTLLPSSPLAPNIGTFQDLGKLFFPRVDTTAGFDKSDWVIKVNDNVIQLEPKLEIVKAVYGTANGSFDVTEDLKKMIVDDALDITATNEIKGDPDPGNKKQLTIEYTIDDKKVIKVFSEDEKVRIP